MHAVVSHDLIVTMDSGIAIYSTMGHADSGMLMHSQKPGDGRPPAEETCTPTS